MFTGRKETEVFNKYFLTYLTLRYIKYFVDLRFIKT